MPDQHTVLYQVLKHVPEARFKELVKAHRSDDAARGLDSKSQFVALLYGQLSGAPGLRAIVTELESHEERPSELGCDPVRRSTLSDANRYRPAALFGDLLGVVLDQVHRGLRRHLDGATYLIDSTSVRLSALSGRWARFSAAACGAKAHIVEDPDADRPIHAGPRHRPDGRQGDADHGRRHLRLRPRLLRLWLVGGPARGRLPVRHAVQDQHPADGGGGARRAAGVRRGRRHPVRPGRPPARAARPAAARTRSRRRCARCG